ncbi:hypothetical protein DW757_13865 [Clostridium sp. AM29-11AC]|nr:hypothetical protein DW757_13865 [Clostridium sp. AM29-11AC]
MSFSAESALRIKTGAKEQDSVHLFEPEASPCRKQREAYEKEKSIGEPACLAFGEGRNLPGSLFIRN